MKLSRPQITIAVLLLALVIVFGARHLIGPISSMQVISRNNMERSKGHPKAPLWIVEYFDFQCPSCRNASEYLKNYITFHPDRVYLQVRFFPLDGHKHGWTTAVYGQCAYEQGRFWEAYDLLFEKQADWTNLENIDGVLQVFTKQIGLNEQAMQACRDNAATRQKVQTEKEEAKSLGVESTPSFFVNGKLIVGPQAIRDYMDGYFKDEK